MDLYRQISIIANRMLETIEQYASSLPQPGLAVIFDIDETLLDLRGQPIVPIVAVYNYVRSAGITPIMITARETGGIEITREQLEFAGITPSRIMYFRPPEMQDPYAYKLGARRDVHRRGYTVIASVGDQPWDIGHYGGRGFIVPSPA
jgi:hypothetical protein